MAWVGRMRQPRRRIALKGRCRDVSIDRVHGPVCAGRGIWWGEGERAFAASKGQSTTESDALAKTAEGQAYLRNAIATKIKASVERQLAGRLTGARPVRIEINVKDVTITSAIQRVLVGGHHSMTADIRSRRCEDRRDGHLALRGANHNVARRSRIAGAMVEAALIDEPNDRGVNNYAQQYARGALTSRHGRLRSAARTNVAMAAGSCETDRLISSKKKPRRSGARGVRSTTSDGAGRGRRALHRRRVARGLRPVATVRQHEVAADDQNRREHDRGHESRRLDVARRIALGVDPGAMIDVRRSSIMGSLL